MGIRNTFRYNIVSGGRIIYRGITNNPARRAREHKRNGKPGRLRVVGPRVTRSSARNWERRRGYR